MFRLLLEFHRLLLLEHFTRHLLNLLNKKGIFALKDAYYSLDVY